MTEPKNGATRREFLKTTGALTAASALTGVTIPPVHAAGSDVINIALVGCGGRDRGAVSNALSAKGGPLELVAMADVFKGQLDSYSESRRWFSYCPDGVDWTASVTEIVAGHRPRTPRKDHPR